jgi:uncharacterized LabA/DUF88 family protein
MKRVSAYIDGFNFYHPINDYYNFTKEQGNPICLKWLNYKSLVKSFLNLKLEELIEVKFFTAVSDLHGVTSQNRHLKYIAALENLGIKIFYGKFLPKYLKCRIQNCLNPNKEYKVKEEKRTDINIAVELLKDSFANKFDKAISLSSDTDFVPAAKYIKEQGLGIVNAITKKRRIDKKTNNIHFSFDKNNEIENITGLKSLEVDWKRMKNHLLPDEMYDATRKLIIKIPNEYKNIKI